MGQVVYVNRSLHVIFILVAIMARMFLRSRWVQSVEARGESNFGRVGKGERWTLAGHERGDILCFHELYPLPRSLMAYCAPLMPPPASEWGIKMKKFLNKLLRSTPCEQETECSVRPSPYGKGGAGT